MDRQTRLLLILVAVLVALVALDRYWTPEDALANPDATSEVWTVEEPDIASISVVREDGAELEFERVDGVWFAKSPFVGKANQRVIGRIARVLAEVHRGEPIEMADPEPFGLADPPRVRVAITRVDGTQASFEVGRVAPSGWKTYVRGGDGTAVIEGELENSLFLDPAEYRNRHLLDYDPSTVRSIHITSEPGVLGLQGNGREWWVDGYGRADLDSVEALVAGLLDLQVQTFLDGAFPEGIPNPMFTVVIGREGLSDIEMQVGEVTPMGQLVQVVGGAAGAVPSGALSVLGQPPTSVSDPHAVPIRQVKPRKISVDLGGKSWAVDFGDEGWSRTGELDREAFEAVEILRGISTAPQLEPVPDLTEAWGRVVLTGEDGVERVIRFGQRIGDKRVAMDEAGGTPYLVLEAGVQAAAQPFE